MIKKAVFPGSFDPITAGHFELVKRALPLFDEIIVAIGVNASKQYMFSLEERFDMINQAFDKFDQVQIMTFEGLTVNFCKDQKAQYILRGLRNGIDFEYEKNIAQMNRKVESGIETVFIVTDPALSPLSSTIVRDIIKNGGDVAQFLPPNVKI